MAASTRIDTPPTTGSDVPSGVEFDQILPAAIHDAKNSLSILLSRLDEFTDQHPAGSPKARTLSDIRYEIQRINSSLVRLLTLHKINERSYSLDISLHAVEDLLRELLLNYGALLEGCGIAVETDCPDGLHWYFDYNLMMGVLGNALNNAVRYARSRIRLSAEERDGFVSIYVEDDGPGYPKTMLATAPGPRPPSPERGFIDGSTGLGLFFSEIATQLHRNGEHRGRISLENGSSLGGGRFGIHLP